MRTYLNSRGQNGGAQIVADRQRIPSRSEATQSRKYADPHRFSASPSAPSNRLRLEKTLGPGMSVPLQYLSSS